MVDINDLPFRILCRKYGTELTFTQMHNVKLFGVIEEYRKKVLSEIDNNLDYPCFIQFSGNDPELFLKSAKYVENLVPCIDINLGCPQNIARMGHYGSFLLDNPEEVYKIVGYLCNNNLKCGVSCKIRLFPDLSKTFELVKKLEDLGISVLTVHGRTKEQKSQKCGKCNWDAIKEIKKLVKIPVIANGGLGTFEDIDKCFEYTGCDCVMSGEKLIEMPTFFSKKLYDINDIALEYCDIWKKYKPNNQINKVHMSQIRGHMFKFFYIACNMYPEYNQNKNEEGFRWPILEHGASNPNRTLYGVLIEKCHNDSLKNNCSPIEEIENYIKNYSIAINFLEQFTDVLNYKKSFVNHITSMINEFNSGNTLSLNNLNFNPTIIKTYGGFVFEKITEDKGYGYTQNEKMALDSENTNIVIAFYFWMENIMTYNERHYKKFPELFSEIGGLGSFILLTASFINYIFTHYKILLDTQEIIQNINKIHLKNKINFSRLPTFYRKANEIVFLLKKIII